MTTPVMALLMVPREGGSAGLIFMVEMVLIIAIFYFLLIRPQSQQRKRHEARLKNIKKGDEVVTSGGIIGKVVHVDQDRLTIRTGENTRLTVERGRIAKVIDPRDEQEAKK